MRYIITTAIIERNITITTRRRKCKVDTIIIQKERTNLSCTILAIMTNAQNTDSGIWYIVCHSDDLPPTYIVSIHSKMNFTDTLNMKWISLDSINCNIENVRIEMLNWTYKIIHVGRKYWLRSLGAQRIQIITYYSFSIGDNNVCMICVDMVQRRMTRLLYYYYFEKSYLLVYQPPISYNVVRPDIQK